MAPVLTYRLRKDAFWKNLAQRRVTDSFRNPLVCTLENVTVVVSLVSLFAQRGCGCPIPGSVQARLDGALSNLV